MNYKEQLDKDMKAAMKAKETLKLSTIRMLKAAIKNEEIAKIKDLDDDEILAAIQREIKKRKESADEYRKANRDDLAQKEEEEAKILYAYLPEQASDEEIRQVVENIVKEIPEGTKLNMGMIMPKATEKLKGRADGKRISTIVKEFVS
jgi:uncharacterized protein